MEFAVPRQDDENYWTTSGAKGFDFDSDDLSAGDNYFNLFGTSRTQTAQLSQKLKENLNLTSSSTNAGQQKNKLRHSTSQSSLSSESSLGSSAKPALFEAAPELAVACKLLSSTVQNDPVLSPQDAVRSLFLGLPIDLHSFKKVCDKRALLEEAAKLGDGNCISAVLLFLQRTLSEDLLYAILSNSSVAWQHYAAILKKQNELQKAAEFVLKLGKVKEAASFLYQSSLQFHGIKQLTSLQQSAKDLSSRTTNLLELEAIHEHIDLLERQLPISDSDLSKVHESEPKPCSLIGPEPLHASLVNSSLLATLQYCCRHHWNISENFLASPEAIRKKFHITDREYVWAAVIGRARAGSDPTSILITKSLFGTPKIAGSVSLPRVLEVLHTLECSSSVIAQLLPLIENTEQRCQLAKRFKCHRIVADVLISQRDRLGLLKYKELVNDPNVSSYMDNILRGSSIKWKN